MLETKLNISLKQGRPLIVSMHGSIIMRKNNTLGPKYHRYYHGA